jgi:hypothetical protein
MKWPFPNTNGGQCDFVVQTGTHCNSHCPGCGAPTYGADAACPTDCNGAHPDKGFINPHWYDGLPAGNTDPESFPNPLPPGAGNGADGHQAEMAVEDTLTVPADIKPGDYVLGWRWDAEMTSQIWQSCSDITIV